MKVKGILVEGRHGEEYLLGFAPDPAADRVAPTLSRRRADGSFEAIADRVEASKTARFELGPFRGPGLLGPGWGKHLFLWSAYRDALASLPSVPMWPTWTESE